MGRYAQMGTGFFVYVHSHASQNGSTSVSVFRGGSERPCAFLGMSCHILYGESVMIAIVDLINW